MDGWVDGWVDDDNDDDLCDGLTALTQTFLRIFPRMCASRFFPSKQ